MRIFLSYASEDRSVAESVYLALVGEGHQVFFDRTGTEAGEGYNQRIRAAIFESDRLVFLISAYSVEPGRYTLTELSFAQQKWQYPAGKVLPVMISKTDLATVPAYLKAITILQPHGDIPAEVAGKLAKKSWFRGLAEAPEAPLRAGSVILLVILIAAVTVIWVKTEQGEGPGPHASLPTPIFDTKQIPDKAKDPGRSESGSSEASQQKSTGSESLLQVQAGHLLYEILETKLNQYAVGEDGKPLQLAMRFSIRITDMMGLSDYVDRRTVRLLVDGAELLPENSINVAVYDKQSVQTDALFIIPAKANRIELLVGRSEDATATLPINLKP